MTTQTSSLPRHLIEELTQAIQSLRYGSVEITAHDGHVTQIEKREKLRFNTVKPTVSNSGKENDS